MIDVPIQVKDALREGRLRKNYRFEVQKEVEQKDPVILATLTSENSSYTIPSDGTYILYNEGNNHAFDWVEITGSTSRAEFCPVGETETWLVISGTCYTGDVLTINNFNADAVYVTRSDLVTYTKAWEYDFTIDNDNLVSESVNIDERMCSGDQIKYGLCEGSSLEFQYFMPEKGQYEANKTYMHNDLVRGSDATWRSKVDDNVGNPLVEGSYWTEWMKPNITGRQLKVFVDIEYGESTPYAIPMGYFTVKNCSRQASTGIIKAVCYNKLQSDYLDAKANSIIEEIAGDHLDGSTSLYTIIKETLGDYGITEKPKRAVPITSTSYPSPSSVIFDTVSMKIVGSSTTYYAAIGNDEGCYVNINTEFSRGTMITFTALSDFIEVMRGIVAEIKNTIFTDVQNSATVWNNLINAGLGNYISMAVSFYDSQYIYFYTLSEILRTPEYNQRAIEGITNLYNVRTLSFRIADKFGGARNGQMEAVLWSTQYILPESLFVNKIFASEAGEFNNAELISVDVKALPDVTLRELQSAVFETVCQFGQLNRETDLFSGVELNRSRLLPADTLYPDNALYPDGAQESAFRSQYSKLWADEGNVRKWRYLIITYKGLDENQQEKDFTLQRTVNSDGTDDYNCSDNWLFRNLVWTAADIGAYADAMVLKMQGITWFPFEMWCAGLPYLETGDEIEIPLGTETYTSYILQRQLKGIQNLQDTYINGTLDIF